jgi:hypothetical protein
VPVVTRFLHRLLSDESGAVAVVVAVAFPVLLLAGVLAVDVSHWNVDKRELQVQADAGALAGGAAWRFPCNSTTEASILSNAQQYASDAASGASRQNTFKDLPDAGHHVLYNSSTFFGNRTKPDPGGPALTGHPCADGAIDVKVTQTDVPAFFGITFVARHIDATARAELKTATGVLNLSPIGVPMPSPSRVYAQFVNESTGAPYSLGTGQAEADGKSFRLTQVTGTSNPVVWQSPTVTPQGVEAGDKVGVRVMLDAADVALPSGWTCNDAGRECDSNEGNTWATLESVRQWPQTSPDTDPSANFKPFVKAVRLAAGTCNDPYFDDVPVTALTGCKMDIFATVKFNPSATSATIVGNGNKEAVTAIVHATKDISVPLTFIGNDQWRALSSIPVLTNAGRTPITLQVDQADGNVHGTGSTNRCPSTKALCSIAFDDAQRTYGANSLTSGYVQNLEIDQPSTNTLFANSLPACSTTATTTCPYDLKVTLGIASLHIAIQGERPTTLRVLKNSTGNASSNGSLNCDPSGNTNLQTELTFGCNVSYRLAVGNECDSLNNWPTTTPYGCVQTKPGESKQTVGKAMAARILGSANASSCTGLQDNQWDSGSPNDLPSSDPRKIGVFLTDFAAFTGAGRTFVPVRGFAEFYVTGWSGQEKNNGSPICAKNDPVPGDADGYLVGHFIKDIAPPGVPDNGQACDPNSLDLCTAVLTR